MSNTTADIAGAMDTSKLGGLLGGPVELPATRYRQGRRTMYHLVVSLGTLVSLFRLPNPDEVLPGNRKVDRRRAKEFGGYLISTPNWVVPAVIMRVDDDDARVQFQPATEDFSDGTCWGVLTLHRSILHSIFVLDGQHRTLGSAEAFRAIADRVDRLKDDMLKNRRKETAGGPAANPDEIETLLRRSEELALEHISIDIAVVDREQGQQMFVDIATHAKGVNPDFTTMLDQREVLNRIGVQVMDHPLLAGRVEYGQERRMTKNNPNLVGAKSVADIARAVFVGTGRVGGRVEAQLTANESGAVQRVRRFLDALVEGMPSLAGVADGSVAPQQLRESSLLGSATMLRVLAAVYHNLSERADPLTYSEMVSFLAWLSPMTDHVPVRGWEDDEAKDVDKIWMSTGAFLPGAMAPQARQGSIIRLVDALTGWARSGLATSSN